MAEKEYIDRTNYCNNICKCNRDFCNAMCPLFTVPAADVVEVRHGEWVEGAEHFTNGFYEAECSVCGNYIRWNEGNSGEWNYCPNCGAKMWSDNEQKK